MKEKRTIETGTTRPFSGKVTLRDVPTDAQRFENGCPPHALPTE